MGTCLKINEGGKGNLAVCIAGKEPLSINVFCLPTTLSAFHPQKLQRVLGKNIKPILFLKGSTYAELEPRPKYV